MNKWLKILVGVISGGCITALCYAASVTENGVTLVRGQTEFTKFWSAVVAENANPGTSTATYNIAGGTSNTSGSINCKRYGNENIALQVDLATLGSTGIDVDVEAIFGTGTSWTNIYTKSFSAITTKDWSLTLQEEPWKVRVSTQATGTEGTDDITVTMTGEEKQ